MLHYRIAFFSKEFCGFFNTRPKNNFPKIKTPDLTFHVWTLYCVERMANLYLFYGTNARLPVRTKQ